MVRKNAVILLSILFLFIGCVPVPHKPTKKSRQRGYVNETKHKPKVEPDVFIIYIKTEGRDVPPPVGTFTGKEYHITYNGQIKVFERFYKSDPVFVNSYYVDLHKLNQLDSLFKEVDFVHFPDILPRTDNIIIPATHIALAYRPSRGARLKAVRALSINVDEEYYPEGFFDLYGMLNEVLYRSRK
ncbi:MAG TPA: hypothetical protein ENK44_07235 [Caldithrix abyssi]|uniref:Lipoprotein n=1 Tax=Caldithrix abyssi TaxID=187145 RepID=A0A7V4WUL8_CALAY|nr:hypothetical protein [Caldithrix abyssi]